MEKRMVSMMLATSMAFLLLAGCGGSGNTSAAATAEATDETEIAEEKDASEEKTAETQEGATEKSVTESAQTTAEGKKYLVKTRAHYSLTEDGEKTLSSQEDYEYDERGNCVSIKWTSSDGTSITEAEYAYDEYDNMVYYKNIYNDIVTEEYYENELDEENRVLKSTILDGEKNPTGKVKEYSYTDDHYEVITYDNDVIVGYEEGFVSDGKKQNTTLEITYDDEHPKTEDEESFSDKIEYEYEGENLVASKQSFAKELGGGCLEYRLEYDEIDENNNPLVAHCYVKNTDGSGFEEIIEYTYLEME